MLAEVEGKDLKELDAKQAMKVKDFSMAAPLTEPSLLFRIRGKVDSSNLNKRPKG